MNITTLLFLFVATAGMTGIVVDGTILMPVKSVFKKFMPAKFMELFDCYQCSGFWCGAFCGYLLLGFRPAVLIVAAMAGSYVAQIGTRLQNLIESKILIDLGDPNDTAE